MVNNKSQKLARPIFNEHGNGPVKNRGCKFQQRSERDKSFSSTSALVWLELAELIGIYT